MSQEPITAKRSLIITTSIIALTLTSCLLAAILAEPHSGTLKIMIKSSPVDLSKLEVTTDSLEVQSQDESWMNITFINGLQSLKFDLLPLQGVSQDLATTQIPARSYTKMRLHISEAIATYDNGTAENLNVPSEKLDATIHFEIKKETTTNILIDMTVDFVTISGTHKLLPTLMATQLLSTTPTPTHNPSILDASPI
jgi:hypothetical protein